MENVIKMKRKIEPQRVAYSEDTKEETLAARSIAPNNDVYIDLFKNSEDKYAITISSQKGNNIVIECDDIEKVNNYIEKIQLNIAKIRINNEEVKIESTGKERVKLTNGTYDIDIYDSTIENEMLKKYNELCEIYELPNIDNAVLIDLEFSDFKGLNIPLEREEKIQNLKNQLLQLKEETTKFVVTNIDQITINGETLEKTRDVANALIENANISENPNEKIVDFERAGYSDAIQDYLAKFLYDKEFVLPRELKEALDKYKLDGFMPFNNFMRGNFKEFERLYKGDYSVEKTIESLIKIDAIAKVLPKRKYDIMLSRIGNGVNKSIEIGSENMYDSFVSFGTNGGTAIGGNKLVYKRLCKADEPVIPVELVATDATHNTECEIITLPFSYEVTGYKEPEKGLKQVEMGNVELMDTATIIKERLLHFKEWLEENKNKIESQKSKIDGLKNEKGDKIFEARGYNPAEIPEEQLELEDIIDGYSKPELDTIMQLNEKISKSEYQYDSDIHGANHTKRVAFFARTLAKLGNLSTKDRDVLLLAAEFHDIGREHDYEDKSHGEKSIEVLKNNKISHGDSFDKDLVEFLIREHSKSKAENEQALLEVKDSKRERYRMLLDYFKDADKLDRVRLGKEDGLDVSRLTMPESRKLVKMAYQAHEYLFDMLEVKTREEKVNQMYDEANNALESFEEQGVKFEELTIETSDLMCFDDNLSRDENINSEELLESAITRSIKETKFSRITGIVKNIRDKLLKREKDKNIATHEEGVGEI